MINKNKRTAARVDEQEKNSSTHIRHKTQQHTTEEEEAAAAKKSIQHSKYTRTHIHLFTSWNTGTPIQSIRIVERFVIFYWSFVFSFLNSKHTHTHTEKENSGKRDDKK